MDEAQEDDDRFQPEAEEDQDITDFSEATCPDMMKQSQMSRDSPKLDITNTTGGASADALLAKMYQ